MSISAANGPIDENRLSEHEESVINLRKRLLNKDRCSAANLLRDIKSVSETGVLPTDIIETATQIYGKWETGIKRAIANFDSETYGYLLNVEFEIEQYRKTKSDIYMPDGWELKKASQEWTALKVMDPVNISKGEHIRILIRNMEQTMYKWKQSLAPQNDNFVALFKQIEEAYQKQIIFDSMRRLNSDIESFERDERRDKTHKDHKYLVLAVESFLKDIMPDRYPLIPQEDLRAFKVRLEELLREITLPW